MLPHPYFQVALVGTLVDDGLAAPIAPVTHPFRTRKASITT
jgi:hypothetical protein